jgi:hypothetical protein
MAPNGNGGEPVAFVTWILLKIIPCASINGAKNAEKEKL